MHELDLVGFIRILDEASGPRESLGGFIYSSFRCTTRRRHSEVRCVTSMYEKARELSLSAGGLTEVEGKHDSIIIWAEANSGRGLKAFDGTR